MKVCLPEEVVFLEAKPERNMTSEGKQSFIYSYKGHKLFIIPRLHTQQQSIFLN